MKKIEYLNFPVSFLRERDLIKILEMAILFCSYEEMIRNKADRTYFQKLIEKKGLNLLESDYFNEAKKLYEGGVKSVRCGVNYDVFTKYASKSKDDLNLEFRAYCATKAILGKKTFKKTRYQEIFTIMFGYTNYEDISEKTKLELKKIEDSRYMKRLLEKLEQQWHLSIYSLNSRGLYISYTLSPVNLIIEVKKSKILHKNRQLINEKEAEKSLESFYKEIELLADS